jgi:hypothetical protein
MNANKIVSVSHNGYEYVLFLRPLRLVDCPENYHGNDSLRMTSTCKWRKNMLTTSLAQPDDPHQCPDAANDAHASLSIYNRCLTLLTAMPKQPNSSCYSFHFVTGVPVDSWGGTWSAINPDYDPGTIVPLVPSRRSLYRARKKQRILMQKLDPAHDPVWMPESNTFALCS